MNGNSNEFDPVAAAAKGALQASQRSLQDAQQQAGAPQAPGQASTFNTAMTVVDTLSDYSPVNVVARGQLPQPSQQLQRLQSSLPTGAELQGQFQGGFPAPQGLPAPPQLPGLGGQQQSGTGTGNSASRQRNTSRRTTPNRDEFAESE